MIEVVLIILLYKWIAIIQNYIQTLADKKEF